MPLMKEQKRREIARVRLTTTHRVTLSHIKIFQMKQNQPQARLDRVTLDREPQNKTLRVSTDPEKRSASIARVKAKEKESAQTPPKQEGDTSPSSIFILQET